MNDELSKDEKLQLASKVIFYRMRSDFVYGFNEWFEQYEEMKKANPTEKYLDSVIQSFGRLEGENNDLSYL